ncbi:MAG: hypothetical protein SGILL_008516, partial [Bacillariaceae sp.]
MSSFTSKASPTSLILTALAGSVIAGYLYGRRKSQQPRRSLVALQGNFYGTGSDVCRLYGANAAGLVVVITGTTSGLGAQTAKLLGEHGAFVIMGNRRPNNDLVKESVKKIERAGGRAMSLALDLASLESVREFSNEVKRILKNQSKRINVLIHNAGVSFLDGSTKDGFQRVWQVNALAPALLTELCLPMMSPESGRVIWISSEMHRFCWGRNLVDQCPPKKEGGSSMFDYALSKACQVMQANELNHREGNGITGNIRGFAIEPGLVRTQIGRHAPQLMLEVEY